MQEEEENSDFLEFQRRQGQHASTMRCWLSYNLISAVNPRMARKMYGMAVDVKSHARKSEMLEIILGIASRRENREVLLGRRRRSAMLSRRATSTAVMMHTAGLTAGDRRRAMNR